MSSDKAIKSVLTAVPKLVQILTSLSAEERQRAIAAAMMMFGDGSAPQLPTATGPALPNSGGIAAKAQLWMKKSAITRDQLDHVFSIEDDSIDVIASRMPASGKRQQTVQAYLICGVKSFLKIGEPAFTDMEGRELCSRVGCYDVANHSNYRKAFGNLLTGSKDSGWKLTNPGLSEVANLIKQLAPM